MQKFWGDKQRALWYVMVFSGVVNSNIGQLKLNYAGKIDSEADLHSQIQERKTGISVNYIYLYKLSHLVAISVTFQLIFWKLFVKWWRNFIS